MSDSPHQRWRVAGPAIVVGGAAVVLLARQPLSWDEAVTISAATRPLPHLWALLGHTDAPLGLFYLLVHGWLAFWRWVGLGPDALLLRLPSMIAALAALPLARITLRPLIDARAANRATLLLAAFPLFTFYAADARPYAMAVLAVLLSLLALQRALTDPGPRRFALYGLAVVACLYLQLFALYAILPQALLARRAGRTRAWAVTMTAAVLATVPLLWVAAGQTAEIGWIPQPNAVSVGSALARIMGGPLLAVAAVIVAAVVVRGRPGRWPAGTSMLAAWALLPAALLVAGDFVVRDLVPRYALVSAPAVCALIALATVRMPATLGRRLFAGAVAVAAVASVVAAVQPYKYEDYRGAVDAIGDHAEPGDAIVFWPASARLGWQVYAGREEDVRGIADITQQQAPDRSGVLAGIETPPGATAVRLARADGLFVLSDHPVSAATLTPAQRALLPGRRLVWTQRFGAVWATLYERP